MGRGLVHHRAGHFREAIAAYDEALAAAPDKIAALVNKGVALRLLGRAAEAMACYWRALAIDPDNLQTWCNAGNALLDLGRTEEAQVALETALRKGPLIAETWLALGNVLVRRERFDAAEACLRRAVRLAPDNIAAHLQLAGLLEPRKPEAALAVFAALRKLAPAEPAAHSGSGQALISLGRLDEAEPFLRHALQLDGNHLDAHLGLARLLLLKGDLAAGWAEYEWRRKKSEGRYPKLPGAEWDGADPTGKTILVYAEQGFGDTIQFVRLLPLLAEKGARVVVVCQKSLLQLIQRVKGVTSAQAVWKPLPAYDFWIPLLSLPGRLGITADNIPAEVPYLPIPFRRSRESGNPADRMDPRFRRDDEKNETCLPAPLGTRLRVGLAWAGSPTHGHDQDRSAGLETLLPLTGVTGTAFYSLQAGPRAADLGKFAHPALIAGPRRPLEDFAETAALVAGLDLVITVDTAVAHLAGALGKAAWVLIPCPPDWRWQTGRDDSPWYPTMRLFRQSESGEWGPVVDRLVGELQTLAASRPLPAGEEAEIVVHSVFSKEIHHEDTEDTEEKKAEKKELLPALPAIESPPCSPCLRGENTLTPRFRMTAPRSFLSDPGIRYLVHRERAGAGYEYATRSFLDAHLQPGDLFIDVGAHWGIMSLQAVTRWPGKVEVLAIEPSPGNLPYLRRWIDDNGVAGHVEVVGAAASDVAGRGELRPESTMGHSLIKTAAGTIPVVTIDGLLAERPHLDGRRVVVKIDVEGFEPEAIQGMAKLLATGRVAAVIWERGIEYDKPEGQKRLKKLRARFDDLGFTAWRFASEDAAGRLVPFVEPGERGNIFELAPGLVPEPGYGLPRLPAPAQPDDPALDAALQARTSFQASVAAHKAGQGKEALALYAQAAGLDATLGELFNNLGVTLRSMERLPAAEASYRRALALSPDDAGVLSNLGNVVREQGRLAEAADLQARALALAPDTPGTVYNAGVVQRDAGAPEKALALFERALVRDPGNKDLQWDRALALLQSGDYARGFPAYEARWGLARARPRKLPMPLWDGGPLRGRTVFLTDEQGFGDVLQFARFIPEMKRRGAGKIVLECQPELMRLLALAPGVDAVIPRERAIPGCDVTLPLLSLPGICGVTLESLPATVPYLTAPEPARPLPDDGRLKLGLVWAGKAKPRDRSIPLAKLLPLLDDPRLAPVSLQVGPRAADLKALGAEAFVTDLGPSLFDFAESAAVLRQLDLLVTIDTAIAHLAGALGVPTFLLLRQTSDWRWFDQGSTSPWYPSFTLFRQTRPNRWEEPIEQLREALKGRPHATPQPSQAPSG